MADHDRTAKAWFVKPFQALRAAKAFEEVYFFDSNFLDALSEKMLKL